MIKRSSELNMTEGPLLGKMVVYTVPLLLSGILQLLYNAADVAVVGNFAADGEKALAAVGSTGSLTNLIIGLFLGLSVGACVVTSQHLGANESRDVEEVVHTSMLSSVILGFFLMIVGIAAAEPMLSLMSTPDDVLDWSALYMRIYFLGLPASMIYNFGSAILRAKGATSYPLVVLIISGAVNVLLNLVMVMVLHLDVAGVAIATVSSQIVSAFMIVVYLCRLNDSCKLRLKRLKIHKNKLIRIIRVGLPAGLQSLIFSLSNVMLQSAVNSLGKTAMAGNTAASSLDGFIYIAQNSVYHTAVTFSGQNFGAKKLERIKRVAILSVLIVVTIGLVTGSLVSIFADPLLSIYAPGEEKEAARLYGYERLQMTALPYIFCGIMDVLTGVLRGMGSSVLPMLVTIISVCGVRILWILTIFPIEQFHNMSSLFFSYPASWSLSALGQSIALFAVYRRRRKKLAAPDPMLEKKE